MVCNIFHFFLTIDAISNPAVEQQSHPKNIDGTRLEKCNDSPLTGWYRDGYCNTDNRDYGQHIICAEMTAEFLQYSASMGNDLRSSCPQNNFPGLKPGDRWCLCASRWLEAHNAGIVTEVIREASHENAINWVDRPNTNTCSVPQN